MNRDQLENREKEFYNKLKERNGGNVPSSDNWTAEELKERERMSCYRMVNSILAYDWDGQTAEELLDWELHRSYKSYLKEYVDILGEDAVLDIIKEQMDSIDRIDKNVDTDSEGLSYNSIRWKKEKIKPANGELKDFKPDELVKKVEKSKYPLFSERSFGNHIYSINVTPPVFGQDVDENHKVSVDIVKEDEYGDNQSRVFYKRFSSYDDATVALDNWLKDTLRLGEEYARRRGK